MNGESRDRDQGTARGAFSLIELLVVMAVIGVLTSLVLSAVASGHAAARRIRCVANLRQLGLAGQMYWDDNGGRAFPYRGGSTNGGDFYWFGWLARGREGTRQFRPEDGALHAYLGRSRIVLCPALRYALANYKFKASGAAYGYGYNLHLAPPGASVNVQSLVKPGGTAFLADAAQVNTFQPPASPEHPMLEEFYFVSTNETTAHFRHSARANVVFCDGHVSAERWVEGSIDAGLPAAQVGQLRAEVLVPW